MVDVFDSSRDEFFSSRSKVKNTDSFYKCSLILHERFERYDCKIVTDKNSEDLVAVVGQKTI